VVRKEVIEKALLAGGGVIHSAAQARAPGPIELQIVTGRTLKRRVDSNFARVVKANAKVAAIGPDADHWYYRFFEFGAKVHDIAPKRVKALLLRGIDSARFAAKALRTGGTRMRPFLRPAVDENGDAAVAAMGRVLADELRKAAR
jgi:HK97 gp10 family phage protein